MRILMPLAAAALLALSGCVKYRIVEGDGLPRSGLGRAIPISNFALTPLEVIEDSRCPAGVSCVWAGRLRLRVHIDFANGSTERELTLGEAQPIAGGMLKLVEATPYPTPNAVIDPTTYGFAFFFSATPPPNAPSQ